MKTLILTILLAGITSFTKSQSLEQWQLATVKITSANEYGSEEAGAGIVVGQSGQIYWILTAAHVIASEEARHEDIFVRFFDNPLTPVAGKIERVDQERDLALISVTDVTDHKITESATIFIRKFELREPVMAVGHPFGNDWNFNVSSQINEPYHPIDNWKFGMTSGGFGPGSSGGPVINDDFKWLGLVIETNAIKTSAVHIEEILKILKFWKVETNLVFVPFEFLNKEDIPEYLFVDDARVPKVKKVPSGKVEYVWMKLNDGTEAYNFENGKKTKHDKWTIKKVYDGVNLTEEKAIELNEFFVSEPITAEQYRAFLNAIRHRISFNVVEDETQVSYIFIYWKTVSLLLEEKKLLEPMDYVFSNNTLSPSQHIQPYLYPDLEVDRNKFRKNTNITEINPGGVFTLNVEPALPLEARTVTWAGMKAYCDWLNSIKADGHEDWRPLTLFEGIYVNQLEGNSIHWRENAKENDNCYYDDITDELPPEEALFEFLPRIGRGN